MDSWNFEHGMAVETSDGQHLRVHAPRWWNVLAHLRWLLARHYGAAVVMTMTTGERMRMTRWVPGARPLTAFAHAVGRWVCGE